MSHSAHRFGTREDLQNDFVVFVRPCKQFDDTGPAERERTLRDTRFLADIAHDNGAENIGRTKPGSISQGLTYQQVMAENAMNGFMSVFTDKKDVARVLTEIRRMDSGLSTVVSGAMEEIFDLCRQTALQPHTVLCSLGIWGKTDLLPSDDHLKIMTLCGHSMISAALIDHCVEMVCQGRMTVEQAAEKVAKPCPCGIFNVSKAKQVFRKMVDSHINESAKAGTEGDRHGSRKA